MKFRDLVEEEGNGFVETYNKLEASATNMDRNDVQFDGYKCSIYVQFAHRASDAFDISIQLHYILDVPNIPDNFLEVPVNYFIGNLKEAVPEFLTKEYLDYDSGRFKVTNITFKYKDIMFHMQNALNNLYRITEWKMMAQVKDEKSVSYNYWIDRNDIKKLDPDLEDIANNLKVRTAKAYGVLRKGSIPKFEHPSGSILLSFDAFTYELSSDYMFWITPNGDKYDSNVRPYQMKINGKDHNLVVGEDELKHIQKYIFKKFQNFKIYITF